MKFMTNKKVKSQEDLAETLLEIKKQNHIKNNRDLATFVNKLIDGGRKDLKSIRGNVWREDNIARVIATYGGRKSHPHTDKAHPIPPASVEKVTSKFNLKMVSFIMDSTELDKKEKLTMIEKLL